MDNQEGFEREEKKIGSTRIISAPEIINNTGLHCIPDFMAPGAFWLFSDYWC